MSRDSEFEKRLQEEADNIKMRDFSEVWEEVEKMIKEKQRSKRRRMIMRGAAAASVVVVSLAIIVPVTLNKQESGRRYFAETLKKVSVNEDTFYSELAKAKIPVADFSDFVVQVYRIWKTPKGETRGGEIEIYEDGLNVDMFASIRFYTSSVIMEESRFSDYNLSYEVNGGTMTYKLKDYVQDEVSEAYIYSAFGKCNNVAYIIEYTSIKDDLLDFFDSLFQ